MAAKRTAATQLGFAMMLLYCEIPVARSPPGKPDLPGRIGGTFEKCHLETFQSPHAEANVHADWPLTNLRRVQQ